MFGSHSTFLKQPKKKITINIICGIEYEYYYRTTVLYILQRVLTCRIAYILKEDPQARVLAVTFTRKAAGEMQERLETLLKASDTSFFTPNNNNGSQQQQKEPEFFIELSDGTAIFEEEFAQPEASSSSLPAYTRELSRATLGTFHKICAGILRQNGQYLAALPSVKHEMQGRNATFLDGSFAIMDPDDQLRIMKECLVTASIDLKDSDVKPKEVLIVLSKIKSEIFNGHDPRENPKKMKHQKHVEIALKIYGSFRENMLSNNLLDFDDLIYLSRELLVEHQEVRQQLHRKWTHILVVGV